MSTQDSSKSHDIDDQTKASFDELIEVPPIVVRKVSNQTPLTLAAIGSIKDLNGVKISDIEYSKTLL